MAALLAVTALAAACGPNPVATNTGSHSPATSSHPSASPTATTQTPVATSTPPPPPVTGAYGVLFGSQAAATYTVTLVGIDGKVVASAQASTPPAPTCANAAAAVVPAPISSSNSRVYFLDAGGAVRYLGPGGDTGQATTVPAPTASRRAMFAVSPDDSRIAVVVDDFNSSGASTRLYVENLSGGGNHLDLFSESGAYSLWPIGWHGTNNLVVAKTASCTQGGGPFCCGPLELHVVDPATANRRFTLGGPSCIVAGPPQPAGVLCETSAIDFVVLNWTAGIAKQEPSGLTQQQAAYLSPNGQRIARTNGNTTQLAYENVSLPILACGWIDDTHLLAGGDAQHQPRVGDTATSQAAPVAAEGDCAGRLPGGL